MSLIPNDRLTTTFEGQDYTISAALFSDLSRQAERVKTAAINAGDTFERGDQVYNEITKLGAINDAARLDYYGANKDDMSAATVGFLQDLDKVMDTTQRGALTYGKGDTQKAWDYANALTSLWQLPEPAKTSDGTFDSLLDKAKSATSSGDMSKLLGEAIEALIAELTGKTPSSAAKPGANAGNATNTANQPTAASAPVAPKAPPKPPVEMRLAGDALAGQMDTNGNGGLYIGKDGLLGIRAGKKDSNKDEIRGNQTMTFKPRLNIGDERAATRFDGATVDIAKLFADKGGKAQEKGFIDVIDNGKLVDRIEMRGDQDGKQSLEIDKPFTELKFSTAGGKNDYAIEAITVRKGGETGEASPASPQSVANEANASAAADNMNALVELLESLLRMKEAIDAEMAAADTDAALDGEDTKAKGMMSLLQALLQVLSAIQKARGGDSDGGAKVSAAEMSDILKTVNELMKKFDGAIGNDPAKKNAYSQVMTALEAVSGTAAA